MTKTDELNQQQVALERLRRRYTALNRLVEVSLVMNSTLEIEPLLDTIMQAAAEITGAEGASILLVEPYTNDLYFAAASNADIAAQLKGIKVPLEGSIAGAIIAADKATIIQDVRDDARHFRGVDEQTSFETRSLLGIPMRIRDRLIGVLEVVNKLQGGFDQDDVRHITILASQAAVAVDNAQLIGELQRATGELQRLSTLKSDFISIASHELRTPLSVVLGYGSVLKELVEGEATEHVDQLMDSALHMRRLLESLTSLHYAEVRPDDLDRVPAPVRELMQGAHDAVAREARNKQQILVFDAPEGRIIVEVDRSAMMRALANVLENAVRFTPVGGVIVLEAAAHGSEAWISVRDSGIGIPEAELESIFEKFYQAGDTMRRREGGLGVGLAIARAIVEGHGGRIWATSPGPDEGSTFTLAIPLMQEPGSKPLDRSRISSTKPFSE